MTSGRGADCSMTSHGRDPDPQARVRQFVQALAERGGFEAYWLQIHGASFNRTEKETILARCRPRSAGQPALDAGCGEGRLTLALAERYAHVYAMDFSEASCQRLSHAIEARRLRNVSVRCHDLRRPLGLAGIDTIVLSQVLQHFDTEEDRLAVLRNLRAALRPGGKIVLTVFNRDRVWTLHRRPPADVDKAGGYPYYHYFGVRELSRLLARAGFGPVSLRGCITLPACLHERGPGDVAATLDRAVSRLPVSRYLGIYLLAEAVRGSRSAVTMSTDVSRTTPASRGLEHLPLLFTSRWPWS